MTKISYTYRATVRRVVDGDTVDLDVDMGFRAWRMNERFRLAGINAPEMRGPERSKGLAAKLWLEAVISAGADVTIQTEKDSDSFGRWIAVIWIGETNVNDAIVAAGHAERRDYK